MGVGTVLEDCVGRVGTVLAVWVGGLVAFLRSNLGRGWQDFRYLYEGRIGSIYTESSTQFWNIV